MSSVKITRTADSYLLRILLGNSNNRTTTTKEDNRRTRSTMSDTTATNATRAYARNATMVIEVTWET